MKLEKIIKITKILNEKSEYVKNLGMNVGSEILITMPMDNTATGRGNYARYINLKNLCTGQEIKDTSLNRFVNAMDGGWGYTNKVFEYEEVDVTFYR